MAVLRVKERDSAHILLDIAALEPVKALTKDSTVTDEIDAMVHAVRLLDPEMPDQSIATCMALMARCTELKIQLVRAEPGDRRLKFIRTTQLEPLMELVDFTFKASSRLVEVKRIEVDLSR